MRSLLARQGYEIQSSPNRNQSGRCFLAHTSWVVVINEAAQRYWPGEDPVLKTSGSIDSALIYVQTPHRPKKAPGSGPSEPSGNRLRGKGGTVSPNFRRHRAHASVVNIPAGASSNTFRNSSSGTCCRTASTSAGEPYTIRCAKNVFRSSSVCSGASNQTTFRAILSKSGG